MNEQKFVNWDGLVYYDSKIKTFVENNLAECLKFGGLITSAELLPDPEFDTLNYTYTVQDGFISDERFIDIGVVIAPKTTVQVVEVKGVYRYSVFKEEEVNLQPVYNEIEELRTQLDGSSLQLEDIQKQVEDQDSTIENVLQTSNSTVSNLEHLTTTVEELEGVITSIEDMSDRTDERVDGLTENMLVVTTNIHKLSQTVDTKADQSALEGLASETYVQTKIAEAQLNSDGSVDLSVYVTQDEMNTKFEKLQESISYGEF